MRNAAEGMEASPDSLNADQHDRDKLSEWFAAEDLHRGVGVSATA